MTVETARSRKGWTQMQLSAKSGVDQGSISRIERGVVPNPSTATAAALEEALGLDRGTLVFGAEAEALAS